MRLRLAAAAAALVLAPHVAVAQSAADHIAMGDKDYAAMNAASALAHYEAALAQDPKHYEALYKAARTAVDVGEAEGKKTPKQQQMYRAAEEYARRAVAVRPDDAEGHFHLARAIGRNAQSMGSKDRVKFAGVVRDEAMTALRYDPKHPGALHVMGVWNAEVMRLSGIQRWAAKNLLGGEVFNTASWDAAERYMEQAVAVEPDRITHRLDLAKIYADRDKKAKARAELEWILRAPLQDPNDRLYKAEAEQLLRNL